MSIPKIRSYCHEMRKIILKTSFNCQQPTHIGGALSIVEILAALYFKIMKINKIVKIFKKLKINKKMKTRKINKKEKIFKKLKTRKLVKLKIYKKMNNKLIIKMKKL